MTPARLSRCREVWRAIRQPSYTSGRGAPSSDRARRTFSTSACTCQAASSAEAPRKLRKDIPASLLEHLQQMKSLTSFDPSFDFHPGLTRTTPMGPKQRFPVVVTHVTKTPKYTATDLAAASKPSVSGGPVSPDDLPELTGTQLSANEIRSLYRFPLVVKRVVNMTGKGKIPSMFALVVVGNGRGLVGVGEGKDDAVNKAVEKAFVQAVKSMDYVRRFEERTVSGTLQSNFGSTQIQMRPRPPGFGLRVNHFIHQVAKAAGIKDLSAKVIGSRNGVRVIKLAVQMLHGGSVPVDLDDGFGHKGQRRNKKTNGMMTPEEVASLRGRKAVGS